MGTKVGMSNLPFAFACSLDCFSLSGTALKSIAVVILTRPNWELGVTTTCSGQIICRSMFVRP